VTQEPRQSLGNDPVIKWHHLYNAFVGSKFMSISYGLPFYSLYTIYGRVFMQDRFYRVQWTAEGSVFGAVSLCFLPVYEMLYRHFLGQTFPGQDVRFPDNHFPGQTFPWQVILRNFHVHNVCKYQLYYSHTIGRYTERLLIIIIIILRGQSLGGLTVCINC